jgi:membrane-associated phospholipid phosphatase
VLVRSLCGTAPAAGLVALVAGASLLVVLIGWCRLYLGAHWLTDVLTGWLLGAAWLVLAVTALALLDRVVERSPVEPALDQRASAG